MHRLATIAFLVLLTSSEGAISAGDDPMQAVAEQATVLDAAPRLSAGTLELDGQVLGAGVLVWIEVEQDGLYELSLSNPGSLVLGSFPTPDGRYDGSTAVAQHLSAQSQEVAPALKPLLLSPAHPYLLSASSSMGAGTLELTLLEAAPVLSEFPEDNAVISTGDSLYAATDRATMTVPATTETHRLEVIGEVRARYEARADGMFVPASGVYPWITPTESKMWFKAEAGEESAPPRVLVRFVPEATDLDESEPNLNTPNNLELGASFSGHLLKGDRDQLAFDLEADADLDLSIAVESSGKYSIEILSRSDDREARVLWRKSEKTEFEEALTLARGRYLLVLHREDATDAPMPYSVRLTSGAPPGPNREVEPNDTTATAMPLPDSLRVSATATPDDIDVYRFSVPDDLAGHLWRVFTVDANRIQLTDSDGTIADIRASGRRSMVDALALTPGEYHVTVRADGDYMLRVMDLGPRPSDFEGEPNNDVNDGQRLVFGSGVRGGFADQNDIDYYLFRLDAASSIEIKIQPVKDGSMDVKLYRGNHQIGDRIAFEPGDAPYTFQSRLPAGDWTLGVRALGPAIKENYEVSVDRLPASPGSEPDDDPLDAIKLPRDGDFAGSVGAFDDADQVFIPLPRGEGQAALICNTAPQHSTGRWRLYNWSDESKLADVRQGIVIFSYGPELGGAVRFGMDGTDRKIPYDCAMRFPPIAAPPPVTPYAPNDLQASADGELTLSLARGESRRATINAEGPEPRFALNLEDGEMAFLGCRDGNGATLTPASRVWDIAGAETPANKDLLGDLLPIQSGTDPMIVLNRTYATRHTDGALPLDVDCTLYGIDDLPRPADMGPPAELRVFEVTADDGATDAAEPAKPPPPGLEALIRRATPDRQSEGDLPVAISIEAIPELAAFSEAGQRFTVQATISSEAETTLPVSVSFDISGEGWQVTAEEGVINLAPGISNTVTADISAPPWLVPSLSPSLVVRADSGASFNAVLSELAISPTAVPLQPYTHWETPDALRGGLNVLHHGLGARLIDWGGNIPDEGMQKAESGLHDGLAPHIGSINLPLEGVTFRLAASAEIAGVMVQLRSTTDPEDWPAEVEVFLPDSESGWQRIATSTLKSIHAPQYVVFDNAVKTDRLRFVFPRCNSKCGQAYVQEIQAIAVPGSHPGNLPPINAADPELGGHVVWANHSFTGSWNDNLLIGVPSASNPGWVGRLPILQATLAFHQNRAALLQSLNWVGDPDDTARIAEAQVEASLAGPNGPWTALGALPAPPLGENRSTLTLDPPVWARYLRFSFETTLNETRFGPDAIEAIEVPGTSVLGLWQDDQPRAAYEAANHIQPPVPVAPIGGPTRDNAVRLPLATPIRSSVVIERNEDWWRLQVPAGQPHQLRLEFESARPLVVAELLSAQNELVALKPVGGEKVLEAVLVPGEYALRIYEPPRSVVISWDTSGSVAQYIPRTLAAVRTWGRSLQPGRDALQLLPFGPKGFLLKDWAESPEVLEPVLRDLPEEQSSASEEAMQTASEALSGRRGARGIVIMTDAETGMNDDLWPPMLEAMPRVVSLSVDSNSRQNAAVMMDWANVNGGLFQRVIGPLGLADSLELANALFRAPKAYGMTANLEELIEVEGEASLIISPATDASSAVGAVELILDASGSMLQRMEGRRRIDIAHDALTDLVSNTLPEGTPFAFRAFGLKEDACLSELVIPLGPLDRAAAAKAIAGVPAINLAKTAIADSLRATASDLAGTNPPRVVVLVTDGEETCDGDPEAAIAELRASGLDARVNIVGFAIDDAALAETFAAWAEVGGGTYFDANGAEALERSIADALRPRFDIMRTYLDGRTEVVGRATLGEQLTVPAGRLTITPASGASGSSVSLQVSPQASIEVEYTPDTGLTEMEK